MPAICRLNAYWVILLLLGSCTKQEELAPAAGQAKRENIQLLKKEFLAKGYDQLLVVPLHKQPKQSNSLSPQHLSNSHADTSSGEPARINWTPRWDLASQTRVSDSVAYVYVPLEAPALMWVGVKKYLLVKRTGDKSNFSEATYLFKEKENIAGGGSSTRAFFASYTGKLQLNNLATGKGAYLTYKNGVKQENRVPATANSSVVDPAVSSTNSCYSVITCNWTGYCRASYATYGTVTSGIDYCASPDPNNGICQFDVEWSLINSSSQVYCNSDPYNPDPGPGPSDPSTPTEPCFGSILYSARLAPSSAGNYRGATYGNTRNGGTKPHDGIDIYASPGSLISAAQGGVITLIKTSFRPGEYKENSYGNYVEVRTEVNGTVIFLKYNHLDRVTDGLRVGSVVSQDLVIGYSGTTGNAAAAGVVPHVHIQAKDADYHRINPAPYLGVTFDPTTGAGTLKPCQ